jgi:hypothetical protein
VPDERFGRCHRMRFPLVLQPSGNRVRAET